MVAPSSRDLYCILYHSRELLPEGGEEAGRELRRIVDSARRNNREAGVTGVLMFGHGSFVQVLEGPQAPVMTIFSAILNDPRHTDLLVLYMGLINGRAFADWSMSAVPDWDISLRSRTALAAVQADGPAEPSTTSLLNMLLGTLMRQAGRSWTLPVWQQSRAV